MAPLPTNLPCDIQGFSPQGLGPACQNGIAVYGRGCQNRVAVYDVAEKIAHSEDILTPGSVQSGLVLTSTGTHARRPYSSAESAPSTRAAISSRE